MANSLRVKIKKLCHDGKIDIEECEMLLKKLDGHDKQIISDFADKIKNHLVRYCFGRIEQQYCAEEVMDFIGKLLGERDFSINVEKEIADHDKQIRDEVVDEFVDMLKNEWTIDSILCANDKCRLIAIFKRIAEQMKGEQNGN